MVATVSSKGQRPIPRSSVTALRGVVRHSGPALSLADMERAIGKGGTP